MAPWPQTCPFVLSFVYHFPTQAGKNGMKKPALPELESEFPFGWFWLIGILTPLTVTSTSTSMGLDATTCSITAAATTSFNIFLDLNQVASCVRESGFEIANNFDTVTGMSSCSLKCLSFLDGNG